ncbi:MAG: DUF2971 domain-containing protein [Christensenellaceae bacterium]|nr:DUF2971 domain-containing protein [Christensenellaceae bacterium]
MSENKDLYTKITNHLLQCGPTMLYRYRPGNNPDIDSIRKDTIWLSTLKEYNDPFEIRTSIDFEGVVDSFFRRDPKRVELMCLKRFDKNHLLYKKCINDIKAWGKNLQDELSMKQLRLFTAYFCENNGSLLMWAHYANAHKGFCIGYIFKDIVGKFSSNILPVIYSQDYFAVRSYETFADYDVFFMNAWRSKSEEWSYEKEWRLAGEYRINEPYQKGLVTSMIKPSCIYMGVNIDAAVKHQLIEICKEREIKLYQMHLSERNYRLLAYCVL